MIVPDDLVADTFRVLDLSGVLAAAMLGGTLARAERLDAIGFVVLALLSGLGGGVLRDTMLAHGPPVALVDPAYLTTATAGALLAWLLPLDGRVAARGLPVVDAVAVGCWSAVGAQKTVLVGLGWVPAVLLGTVTAVGGSAVRDVAIRRTPAIFGGRTLYATSAALGSTVTVGLLALGRPTAALMAGTAAGAGLTLLARRRGWELRTAGRPTVGTRDSRRRGGGRTHDRRRGRRRRAPAGGRRARAAARALGGRRRHPGPTRGGQPALR